MQPGDSRADKAVIQDEADATQREADRLQKLSALAAQENAYLESSAPAKPTLWRRLVNWLAHNK